MLITQVSEVRAAAPPPSPRPKTLVPLINLQVVIVVVDFSFIFVIYLEFVAQSALRVAFVTQSLCFNSFFFQSVYVFLERDFNKLI